MVCVDLDPDRNVDSIAIGGLFKSDAAFGTTNRFDSLSAQY